MVILSGTKFPVLFFSGVIYLRNQLRHLYYDTNRKMNLVRTLMSQCYDCPIFFKIIEENK